MGAAKEISLQSHKTYLNYLIKNTTTYNGNFK